MGYQNPSSCAADIGKCLNANMLLIDAAQAYFRRALLLAFPANRTADLPYHAGTASRQEVAEEAGFSRIHRLPRPQPPDGGHPPATAQRQPPDGDHQKAGVSKPAGDRD